jgi:hypothetical protein
MSKKVKFGNFEIKIGSDKPSPTVTADDRTLNDIGTWDSFSLGTEKVDEFYAPTVKTFASYKTVDGDAYLNYNILEGLYKKTIVGKIIGKLAGDATRIGYTVKCVDSNDKPHDKAQAIADEISRKIRRRDMKKIYRDRELYGDAFLYVDRSENSPGKTNINKTFAVNSKHVWPKLDDDLNLVGWHYNDKLKGTVDLELNELIHIPRNPLTGELFGNSLLEEIMMVLNLVLNSQLNIAIILDHFAVPMVHWQVDSKDEKRRTPMSELNAFNRKLAKMALGADLVTDASIDSTIVGVGDKVIDFTPILDKLDQYLFATAGVPGSLIGMPADNLSAITRQLQTYYEDILDIQEDIADYLIEDLYRPDIEAAGYDVEIFITRNTPSVEQNSRTATWIESMVLLGVINRREGRETLGFQGSPPDEIDTLKDPNAVIPAEGPRFDKKNETNKPSVGTGS